MKINNLSKILALVLTVAVLFVSVGITTGITSVASEDLVPYDITAYASVSNNGPDALLANNTNASIVREGYNGSYGLKIAGTDAVDVVNDKGEIKGKYAYIRFGTKTNVLAANEKYTFVMRIKKTGPIKSFTVGVNTAWKKLVGPTFVEEDLQNEWTTYTATILPAVNANGVTGWCHMYLSWDIPAGSSIVIDDIYVYKTSDETKTNILPEGSFEKDVLSPLPTVKGNYLLPTSLADYESVSNNGADAVLANNANLSIVREGVNKTYALKIAGTDVADVINSKNEIVGKYGYIKLGSGTNTLLPNIEYTISMKVKKIGTVNSFNAGINTAWNLKKGTALANADIKEDEWTTWTFDVTPALSSTNVTGWCHIYLSWDVPKDSYLLIDDISIAAKTDNYNVIPYGSFDQQVYLELGMNNDPIEGATYYQADPVAMNAAAITSQAEIGYKGSWGGKVIVNDAASKAVGAGTYAQLRFENTSGLENYTEYYIEFKVRKTGNITGFQMRIRERWQDHQAFMVTNPDLVSTYLTEEWSHYIVKYKTNHDTEGAYSYVKFIAYGDPTAFVYVDEVRVYKANDATKTNILKNGDFDEARIVASENAVWEDVSGPANESIYDCVINFGETSRISNRDDAQITKTGVDGTYGLQLTGQAAGKNVILTFGNHTNCLERGVNYIFEVTAKAPGGINNLRIGLRGGVKESYGSWKVNKPAGSELVVSDWTTYTQKIEHTYAGTGTEPKDVWEGFRIEWKSPVGSDVFIDNIKVYREDDPSKTNIFPNGTFDAITHQESPADESKIDNAIFTPNGIFSDKDGSYSISEFDCISNFGPAEHLPQNANASITKAGVDGTFALALKGNGADQAAAITIGKGTNSLTRGTKYVVSMKVKKIGTVNSMSFGVKYDWKPHDTAITPTDDWATYSFELTPSTESTGVSWYHIELDWKAAADAVILIDDISITVAETGEEKFPEGTFDDPKNVGPNGSYKIEEFDAIKNFAAAQHLPQNPNASVEKIGVDGSFGLRLKGNGAEQIGAITIGTGTNSLTRGTKYVISFKAKKVGTVDAMSLGLTYDWIEHPTSFTLTDAWAPYTIEITPSTEKTGVSWYHLIFKWNAPVGSEVLVDDISIVAEGGTVDIFPEGVFDNPADRGYVQGVTLAEGEGVRGSYAGKLEGTGSEAMAEYIFEYANMLENNTEYYIEFKAKKSGNVSAFGFGIMESKDAHIALEWKGADLVNERISNKFYNYYRVKYTTDNTAENGYASSVIFKYTAAAGSYILLDDVRVYKVSDATESDLLRYGANDYTLYDIEFDNKVDSKVTYVAKDISYYTNKHRFHVTDKTKLNASLSIAEKEGVKGSAAMKLAGNGETQTFKYTMQNLSELVNNGTYKLGIKVKVVANEGVDLSKFDSFFKFGLVEDEAKNFHYVMNFSGDDFGTVLTDEYHYYQAEYTTDANCWKVWSFLTFSYALPEGAALYIDDLELIPVSENATWITDLEGNGVNIVNNGSFDSKDNGQTPNIFYTGEVEDERTVCSYYHNSAKAEPKALVGAITGHYALAFGFGEEDVSGEFIGYINPSMPGESYKISFYVKVVGDINDASFSMSDGYWLNHSTGLNFDKYEEGKWMKYEFIYNDKTSGVGIATYRRFRIAFNGPAGSGMLVDNITCTRVGADYEAFNILAGGKGDFEQSTIYPEVDWLKNDRFMTAKEGN